MDGVPSNPPTYAYRNNRRTTRHTRSRRIYRRNTHHLHYHKNQPTNYHRNTPLIINHLIYEGTKLHYGYCKYPKRRTRTHHKWTRQVLLPILLSNIPT